MVIARLLHDVVEDVDVTLSDIRDEFGDEVATLVDGASEPEELINAEEEKVRPGPSARRIPLTKPNIKRISIYTRSAAQGTGRWVSECNREENHYMVTAMVNPKIIPGNEVSKSDKF